MVTKEDRRKRIRELESMIDKAYSIMEMYSNMNHPNRENLTDIQRQNIQNLSRELDDLRAKELEESA